VNAYRNSLWKALQWISLAGLLTLFGFSALADPAALPPSSWNGPVFLQDHWELTGIVEHGIQRRWLFEREVDLIEVRYGHGSLWAMAGITGQDGTYESLIVGSTSREAMRAAFQQPRYITLTMPGTLKAIDHSACLGIETSASSRCQITGLVEGSRTPIVVTLEDEPTGDLSNIFIHTGVFPPHYQYGFLTWDILPGQIIEQGLEGG